MTVPSKYKNAAIFVLVAGIVNLLWSIIMAFVLFMYISAIAISTFGLGCVLYGCMFLPLLPFAMGMVELVTGIQMMSGTRVPRGKAISIAGIVVGAIHMAMIPLMLEIAALVMLNDDEVAAWLAEG